MTLHSRSRGIMYSAPPGTRTPEREAEDVETEAEAEDAEAGDALEPVEADANWTGEALADD